MDLYGERELIRYSPEKNIGWFLYSGTQVMVTNKGKQFMTDGYDVLAFAMDGGLEGEGFWGLDRFSQDLVDDCRALLRRNGEVFTAGMDGDLSHIELQFTGANGAALATFNVRTIPAVSMLLVSGHDANTDSTVTEMFIQSCKKSAVKQVGSISANAFDRIRDVFKRPCMSVVAWSSEKVTDDDFAAVQELSLHLGAAYFYPQLQLSKSS